MKFRDFDEVINHEVLAKFREFIKPIWSDFECWYKFFEEYKEPIFLLPDCDLLIKKLKRPGSKSSVIRNSCVGTNDVNLGHYVIRILLSNSNAIY